MNLTLVKIIISFTVGVAIGIVYEHASVVVLILLLFALYCGILLLTSKIKKLESKYVVVLIILSVICAIGVVRGELYVEPTLPSDLEGKQTFIAEVISIPEEKETTETFRIKLASSTTQLQITAPLYPTYAVGDILKITGVVKLPEVLLPTAIETTTAKSFDYKRYLHTKGIVGELVYPRIEKIDENHEGIIYKLYSIKQHSVEIINSYIPSPESALANGVLLGTDTLPKENKDAIRVASLSHITVLSGFNVAIIITVLLLVLRFLPL
jgi:predicted membrane metal-binding protein